MTKKLSIPRPVIKKILQALEAYQVVQPLADFGTVKPYKVLKMATAVKAAWVTFEPEDIKLLFGVRDGKIFRTRQGFFEHLITTPEGTRWLPPMEASSSFFSAMTDDLGFGNFKEDYRLAQVDAKFLGRLLEEFNPIERDDLLFVDEKQEITQKDLEEARRKRIEKYCWIYFAITEKLLGQDTPRIEYLAFLSEILESCVKAAIAFKANQELVINGETLRKKVESILKP
jgi:hypothetical protein